MDPKTTSTHTERSNIPNENPPLGLKFQYTRLLATDLKAFFNEQQEF